MKMISCEACKNQISSKAQTCPQCGHPNKRANDLSGSQVFFYLLFAAGVLWVMANGGLQQLANNSMQDINSKVANDMLSQYQIAKQSGSAMDACVQAGIVMAAYLQSKDQEKYREWQSIKSNDCSHAGL